MKLEELQTEVLELREQLKEKENLEKQLEEHKERIKSLEEHNQKLFLKATSTSKQEETKEEFKCELLGDYVNLLNDDEIEKLKEIMEDL